MSLRVTQLMIVHGVTSVKTLLRTVLERSISILYPQVFNHHNKSISEDLVYFIIIFLKHIAFSLNVTPQNRITRRNSSGAITPLVILIRQESARVVKFAALQISLIGCSSVIIRRISGDIIKISNIPVRP